MKLILFLLLLFSVDALADGLVFKFKSPTFSGIGYSAHKINLNNMRYNRKKSIRDELRSLELQLGLLEQRRPINAFLSNLQTRIYSELSKQVTEQLFASNHLCTLARLSFCVVHISSSVMYIFIIFFQR